MNYSLETKVDLCKWEFRLKFGLHIFVYPKKNVVMLLVAKFSLFDEEYMEIRRHNT